MMMINLGLLFVQNQRPRDRKLSVEVTSCVWLNKVLLPIYIQNNAHDDDILVWLIITSVEVTSWVWLNKVIIKVRMTSSQSKSRVDDDIDHSYCRLQ